MAFVSQNVNPPKLPRRRVDADPILDLERPKYSYGRKYRKFLPDTEVRLSTDKNGEPDWQFMEQYIKSLPYSDWI